MVIEDLGDLDWEEVMRVLVPNGVAYQKNSDGTWKKSIKPRPKNIDEWVHYLHDATGNSVTTMKSLCPRDIFSGLVALGTHAIMIGWRA